jgi:hypothetical protein
MSNSSTRVRKELELTMTVVEALEPLESDAKRLRVLAACAVLFGHDDLVLRVLKGAQALEAADVPRTHA